MTNALTPATKITILGYEKEPCGCGLQLWFLYYFVAPKVTKKKKRYCVPRVSGAVELVQCVWLRVSGAVELVQCMWPRVSGAVELVQCVWLTSRLLRKHIVLAGRYQR